MLHATELEIKWRFTLVIMDIVLVLPKRDWKVRETPKEPGEYFKGNDTQLTWCLIRSNNNAEANNSYYFCTDTKWYTVLSMATSQRLKQKRWIVPAYSTL